MAWHDLGVRTPEPHVAALAALRHPDGAAMVLDALVDRGLASPGDRVEVVDAELAIAAKPARAAEATMRPAWRVDRDDGAPLLLHGIAVATGGGAAAAAALAALWPDGTGPDPIVADGADGVGVAAAAFTDDPSLPWLAAVAAGAPLDAAPVGVRRPEHLASAVVRYRPGRRVIARFARDGGTDVFAKVHAGGRDRAIAAHLDALAERLPGLPRATVLGHGPATGTIWTDDVGGVTLTSLLGGADTDTAGDGRAALVEAIGRLPELHASAIDAPDALPHAQVAIESRRRARKLAVALPWMEVELLALADAIEREMPAEPATRSTLYGDFHTDQVHVVDGGIRFLDLDSMRCGAVERDLAEVVAHLPDERAQPLVDTIVGAYEEAASRAIDRALLVWYLRCERLQRAFSALKALAPGWEAEVERAVGAAGR